MKEDLVDVLNCRDTVLHVFAIPMEDQDGNPRAVDPEREAVRLAIRLGIVPEADDSGLHARPHVCRRGRLQPFADALEIKRQMDAIAALAPSTSDQTATKQAKCSTAFADQRVVKLQAAE